MRESAFAGNRSLTGCPLRPAPIGDATVRCREKKQLSREGAKLAKKNLLVFLAGLAPLRASVLSSPNASQLLRERLPMPRFCALLLASAAVLCAQPAQP